MPIFDLRCLEEGCNHQWAASKAFNESILCPICYSGNTKTLMPRVQGLPLEQDATRVGNIDKKIKSFAHDRRKGGKDTS